MAFNFFQAPLLEEELKQINTEDYKHFDKEIARLNEANKELVLANEKLTKTLGKKKNELEAEKASLLTSRQLIDELKLKVEQKTSLSLYIDDDYVQKLVMEKSGLESQLSEQKRENQSLNSKINSGTGRVLRSDSVPLNDQYYLQPEIEQLRSRIISQDFELSDLYPKCKKLTDDCHYQQRCIDALSFDKNQLKGQLANCTRDYQQERCYAGRQEDQFKRDRTHMTGEIANMKLAIESLRQEVNTLKKLNNTIKADEQKCKLEVIELNDQIIPLKLKAQGLTEKNAKIETSKQSCKNEMIQLDEQLVSVISELTHLRAHEREIDAELIKENIRLKSELEGLQKVNSQQTPCEKPANLTPDLVPISNQSGIGATRVTLKSGLTANIVKLKAMPYPKDQMDNQVICIVNKHYELGILKAIFEVEMKPAFKSRYVTAKYVGIQFFNPVGNSNGEYRGKHHFDCEANFGYFIPYEDVFVPVV